MNFVNTDTHVTVLELKYKFENKNHIFWNKFCILWQLCHPVTDLCKPFGMYVHILEMQVVKMTEIIMQQFLAANID